MTVDPGAGGAEYNKDWEYDRLSNVPVKSVLTSGRRDDVPTGSNWPRGDGLRMRVDLPASPTQIVGMLGIHALRGDLWQEATLFAREAAGSRSHSPFRYSPSRVALGHKTRHYRYHRYHRPNRRSRVSPR